MAKLEYFKRHFIWFSTQKRQAAVQIIKHPRHRSMQMWHEACQYIPLGTISLPAQYRHESVAWCSCKWWWALIFQSVFAMTLTWNTTWIFCYYKHLNSASCSARHYNVSQASNTMVRALDYRGEVDEFECCFFFNFT